MPYHGGDTPLRRAVWGLSQVGEEALHPNQIHVLAPCREGGWHSSSTHWGPGFPSGAHPPLPALIQLAARVPPTSPTWGTHPCPGTYGRLSLLWLSVPSHAMRKQDFCLGKPRSSSRSETRSRT